MIWATAWSLLKRFSTPLLMLSLLALIMLGSWAALQRIKANSTISELKETIGEVRAERDKAKLDLSEARLQGAKDLADKIEENRLLAAGWQNSFNQAEENRANEKRRLEATLAAANGERDRLRKLTAKLTQSADPAFASGGSCDSPTFRRVAETAETFGELLGTSDGISQDLGAEAEELAGQVRGLQSAFDALRSKVETGELVVIK